MTYITVVTPLSSFCGKSFSLRNDGNIHKEGRATAPAKAWAKTIACDSLNKLAEIINSLQSGQAIILGYVPETVGMERFHLWSVAQMKLSFGKFGELNEKEQEVERSDWIINANGETYLPRKKHLFSRAPFICIDRDIDENAPAHIQAVQSLSNQEFLRVLCEELSDEISSAFYGADFLPVVSSSSQVYTLDGKPYSSQPSAHIYFKVKDADDIDRFGSAMFAHAMASGYSYNKEINRKDNINAFRKQTIFDPSVFTNGRLFFESSPHVSNGLTIVRSDCVTFEWNGGVVDTETVRNPNSIMLDKLKEQGINFHKSKIGSYLSSEGLYHDMVIDTKDFGAMTVAQYKSSGLGKLRCQTPFRDSDSWAAYLNKHDDGEPYLWDEGSRTKYREVKDDNELAELYRMVMKTVTKELSLKMIDLPEHAEIEEAIGSDVVASSSNDISVLEEDLAALVEYSNVYPINDQFSVEEIKNPPEVPNVFTFYDGNKFEELGLRTPEEMYVWGDGALVKGGFTMLGGVPKVGKSSLLMSMLMSAACGAKFLGHQFNEAHKVLWFQGELMPEMLKGRYDKALRAFTEEQRILIKQNLIITDNGNRQLNDAHKADYKRAIELFNPTIVAIDPLRNLTALPNESDATEMITTLSILKETPAMINRDISVICVHHLRKISQQTKSDPFDLFSGSGALRGFYDTGIVMLHDEEMINVKHLHWEIRNGKPMDAMEVTNHNDSWDVNGGLMQDVKDKTGSHLNVPERVFATTLIDLLKSDKAIGIKNAISWSVLRGKLDLIFQSRDIRIGVRTMDRYVKELSGEGVHLANGGRGKTADVYYDGSK